MTGPVAATPSAVTTSLLADMRNIAAREHGDATSMPPMIYRDEGIAAIEHEKIWKQGWVCAGLAAELPNAGDYLTFSVAHEAVYCIRDDKGAIRTYSNVCRHRMMQLLEDRGNNQRIKCPYHAWTYNLEGNLVTAGQMRQTKGFDKANHCLPEFRTEIWNGWIYITLDNDSDPLTKTLAPLDSLVERYNMADYIPIANQDHVWNTNWKLLTENFMEGYHLPIAHKKTVGAWLSVDDTVFPDDVHDGFTYQTFIKTGNATYGTAHPENTRLKDEWRQTSIMPTVFPSHMYVCAPDHLWYLSLRPKGIEQVDIRFGAAIAPEVYNSLENRDEWINELVSFFDIVNSEDQQVVEGIFKGSRSDYAQSGPLSWLEREIHDFQRYLANRLADVSN